MFHAVERSSRSRTRLVLILSSFVLALPVSAQRTPVPTSSQPLMADADGRVPRGAMVVGAPGGVIPSGYSLAPWSLPVADPSWRPIDASSRGARFFHGLEEVDGRLYVIGGADAWYGLIDWMDEYDPTTGTWRPRAPIPVAVQAHMTASVGGLVYVFEGRDGAGNRGPSAVYDPDLDTWTAIAQPPVPRFVGTASVVEGKIYLFGGTSAGYGSDVAAVHVYDPQTGCWSTRASMPTPRWHAGSCVIDGKIHVLGGEISSIQDALSTHEIYDPVTDTWSTGAPMPMACAARTPVASTDSAIYVIGPGCPNGTSTCDLPTPVQVYDAAADAWSLAGTTLSPRVVTAARHVRGRIYVVEGVTWRTPFPKDQQGVEVLDLAMPLFRRD